MIYVIATIELEDGQRDNFLQEFRQIVPLVLAENGCIEYGPTIDIETNIGAQPDVRSNSAIIVEKWDSIEALEAHLIAPHMLTYREKVKPFVKQVDLRIMEPA